MPIEIGPDGTPIVTNGPSTPAPKVEGFEVSKPKDAIKPVTEAKPLVGIDNSIEEAKRFNAKLNAPVAITPLVVAQEQTVNKDVELRSILKRYGMDSQQQEKAFAEIKSLLG